MRKDITLPHKPPAPINTKNYLMIMFLENGALWCLCEMAHAMPDFYRKHANGLLKKLSCSLDETIPSIECYATTRWVNHREIEYFHSREEALSTLHEIRQLLNEHPTHVSFPIEVRM